MTDNRATELREKLDALGIEHFDYDKGGRTQTMWEATDGKRHFTYETQDNPAKTAKLVISWFPTPEQAIAATLGWQPAMLTAGQVREAVLENFEETHETRYDHWEPSKFDWQAIADALNATLGNEINGETSDGYHTFNELYHHRAVLFSVIVRDHRDKAWKARKHHDGTMYDGMFIVGIETPKGQATYHYDLDPYWDMFDCEEREYAPEWDGHTPDEAIARIATLGRVTCEECARTAKKMLEIANEMRHIGASSMTPHQLFCCWAHDIERVVER